MSVLTLPQPQRLSLAAALSYIAQCVGKSSMRDDVNAAFHGALCDGALTATGKYVTYKDPHYKKETAISNPKPIPSKVWQQFSDSDFRHWVHSDYIPPDQTKLHISEPPHYLHPTLARADIDAWLHPSSGWRDILSKAATDEDHDRLLKSEIIQIYKFACFYAGYRPENLHRNNPNWLDSVLSDTASGTPGYFIGILQHAALLGKLKVIKREHKEYVYWREAFEYLGGLGEAPPDKLREVYLRCSIIDTSSDVNSSRPKRGPKAKKLEAVKTQMLAEMHAGTKTPTSLSDEIEKGLAASYSCSRDTARKARVQALAEFKKHSLAS